MKHEVDFIYIYQATYFAIPAMFWTINIVCIALSIHKKHYREYDNQCHVINNTKASPSILCIGVPTTNTALDKASPSILCIGVP